MNDSYLTPTEVLREAYGTACDFYSQDGSEPPPVVVAALIQLIEAREARVATTEALYEAACKIARADLGAPSVIAAAIEPALYDL